MSLRVGVAVTHDGHPLSRKEDKFITKYLELANGEQAVIAAGFTTKNPAHYATELLHKPHVIGEIRYRRDLEYAQNVASGQEVMDYFTKVMRGEITDQFGLEAPLSERTKAAQEIAKRTIDIDNRMAGKKDMSTPEINIKLDWNWDDDEDEEHSET